MITNRTGTMVLALLICAMASTLVNSYQIGVGRADCTGPPVEIGFMGYAQLKQKGQGIHLRQYSRAFIIEQNDKRAVFVSVDTGMMGHAVKRDVIKHLQKKYGDLYSLDNVVISGTHTHGTPGGFLMHLLYDISVLGFVPETFNALVQGITISISRAHDNIQTGRLYMSQTEILNANINRSPSSYLENPAEERAQYKDDVDKTLTQIRFINSDNQLIGAINWFAVHPTSMNNTNRLVSSDNMGYASILLEKEINPNNLPGKGKFVGTFASSNLGDVSPNIMGPKCSVTGNPCDVLTSACPKDEGHCSSSGPGKDMFESTKIIATRIYEGASKLIKESDGREITGDVNFLHQFVDMTKYKTTTFNRYTREMEEVHGCYPAMGYSFAAGTTDGPGAFPFTQGTTTENALWNLVRDFIVPPTTDDIACHSPKPILLATGRATFPYEWQPKIVATQLIQIGDVIIAAVPGEFTTMAGRRLRNHIRNAALQAGGNEVDVILAGLSNVYTSYIVTPEEYQAQRYEAASTIYGPHTLTIYLEQYQKLTQSIIRQESMETGPQPPYMDNKMLSLNTAVVYDNHPIGRSFGSVKSEPHDSYTIGEKVYVSFVAGNPRNNLLHEKSYITVERQNDGNSWEVVLTDSDWDTRFYWVRVSTLLGFSDVHVSWTIGNQTKPGLYRIQHFGHYKYILGGIYSYEGTSRTFTVTN